MVLGNEVAGLGLVETVGISTSEDRKNVCLMQRQKTSEENLGWA